jgi:hypothetical protein
MRLRPLAIAHCRVLHRVECAFAMSSEACARGWLRSLRSLGPRCTALRGLPAALPTPGPKVRSNRSITRAPTDHCDRPRRCETPSSHRSVTTAQRLRVIAKEGAEGLEAAHPPFPAQRHAGPANRAARKESILSTRATSTAVTASSLCSNCSVGEEPPARPSGGLAASGRPAPLALRASPPTLPSARALPTPSDR